ncbi:ligase-associated DNA damage response endonuclease PdeM [uncultured Dokdonia sp.]|uniref:ligase-associated DNA damage response endonuclease PdeM n=1 Tax=uncultured Dokdonia sp. TaxID=575653 RepID=UPI00262345DD|nr:ligase-associated DNA damage response endonuclease PdeM [uncultured Dokdonia sp.]
METTEITIQNQTFTLHPSGALFWKEKSYLLIADVHFGKITHFRKHGSGVPQEAIHKNIKDLDTVCSYFNPDTIIFMGDLFHSHLNTEWFLFEKWVETIASNIQLVTGNHDIIAPLHYEELGIQIFEERCVDTILLTHHPETRNGFFNIAGHIHPGVQLTGVGKQFLKVPCFFMKPNQLIQPAFGTFTGNYMLTPNPEDRVFAVADDQVIEIVLGLQ